jgi:HK97 family phage prohead protease
MKTSKAMLVSRSAPFTCRNADDGDGFTLEGYGAVFDSPTRIDSWEGKFDEIVARGAFENTLKDRKPVVQFDHGRDVATGSVPIGAIEDIHEDSHGLFVRARLHDNDRVEPIRQAIASGAIDGMSFRFRVTRDEWDESGDIPVRTIRDVQLFEVGPVVFAAYDATSVGVRSLLADLTDTDRARLVDDIRTELSDAGSATSDDNPPDAAPQGTLGATTGERAAFLRSLQLTKEPRT